MVRRRKPAAGSNIAPLLRRMGQRAVRNEDGSNFEVHLERADVEMLPVGEAYDEGDCCHMSDESEDEADACEWDSSESATTDAEEEEQEEEREEVEAPSEDRNAYNENSDLEKLSDEGLITLASSLQSKESGADLGRRLLTFESKEEATVINRLARGGESMVLSVCGVCGVSNNCARRLCCNTESFTVNFFDLGAQLTRLIDKSWKEIELVRSRLNESNHILASPYLSEVRSMEQPDEVYISLLYSIDGLRLKSNKRTHVWPLSMAVLDIDDASRTKMTNVMLYALVDAQKTPPTPVWNTILKTLRAELRTLRVRHDGKWFRFCVVSCVADQPAKRALYNFAHESSKFSCFYCTSSGTVYKVRGEDRESSRGVMTIDDMKSGTFGFKGVSEAFNFAYPFHLPVDYLHNLEEGLLSLILKETIPELLKCSPARRKTTLFAGCEDDVAELWKRTRLPKLASVTRSLPHLSGSEKHSFFLAAVFPVLISSGGCSLDAKLVGIATALLMTQTLRAELDSETAAELCEALHHGLTGNSPRYVAIKVHEVIYHLPQTIKLLGNWRQFSTHLFEGFYNYLCNDFKSSITNAFLRKAGTRFVTWKHVIDEVNMRSEQSALCRRFIATISSHASAVALKNPITSDLLPANHLTCLPHGLLAFARVLAPGIDLAGICYPTARKSQDDIVFVQNDSFHCLRFVFAFQDVSEIRLAGYPLIASPFHEQYEVIENAIFQLPHSEKRNNYSRVLALLRSSHSVQCGMFSDGLFSVPFSSTFGQGVAVDVAGHTMCVQITGTPCHK